MRRHSRPLSGSPLFLLFLCAIFSILVTAVRRRSARSNGNKSPGNYDYQEVHRRTAGRVSSATIGAQIDIIANDEALTPLAEEAPNIALCGIYLRTTSPQPNARLALIADGVEIGAKNLTIGSNWGRFGVVIELDDLPRTLVGRLTFSADLEYFGANVGVIDRTIFDFVGAWEHIKSVQEAKGKSYPWEKFLQDLNASHLAPECGYLIHDEPSLCQVNLSPHLTLGTGGEIELKYCSLCERLLPASTSIPGSLAFHGHALTETGGFRSLHQQECRACKKFRINDKGNTYRTSEQLHESSSIHRERSLFLKEPEILQRFKAEYGVGLKTFIWKKFDEKCFRCEAPLTMAQARIDHTRPFAYLWPLDEHATLLCQNCNGEKSDTFPFEFYTSQQLEQLAKKTGLALSDLQDCRVNPDALQDVINNIADYGRGWSAKTFKNVRRKIKERHSDIDLYRLYADATGQEYNKVELADEDDDALSAEGAAVPSAVAAAEVL